MCRFTILFFFFFPNWNRRHTKLLNVQIDGEGENTHGEKHGEQSIDQFGNSQQKVSYMWDLRLETTRTAVKS